MADAKLTSIADLTENYDSSTGQLTVVLEAIAPEATSTITFQVQKVQ